MTLVEKIDNKTTTDLSKRFVKTLRTILDDDEFIYGALLDCDTPEKQRKMLGYIKNKGITNDQDVIALGYAISNGAEPEFVV